jgi:hypothetical protein
VPQTFLVVTSLVLASVALAPARAAAESPAPPAAPPYEESLTVREAEIVVQAPDGLSATRRRALAPGSMLLFEAGGFREVAEILPLESREGEWTVLVALDRALIAPDTLFRSALALGHRAERLARLGSVEVVELGAEPRRWLSPSRDAAAIAQALADLAASSRTASPLSASPLRPPIELAAVQAAGGRLLGEVAGRTQGGAKALVWLTDLSTAPAATSSAGARDLAGLTAAAQAVAAYGWTVIAVGLAPEPEETREHRASEFDRLRQLGVAGTGNHSFPLETGRRSELDRPGALNVFLQPMSALVRALARESGGTLAGVESQLDALLDDLARRLLVVYRTPAVLDGELRAVEVRLLPDDLALRAVRWQRSGTPEPVAELRLGEVTAKGGQGNGLRVRVTLTEDASGRALRVEPEPDAAAEERSPGGPVRLTWAGAGSAARHRLVARPLGPGWSESLPLDPSAGATWSVVVEDLGRGLWTGVTGALPVGP